MSGVDSFDTMTEDVEVVVGIPTYNNEDTIGETLDALGDQFRQPDRVVFCDKSDDRTVSIIHERASSFTFEIDVIEQCGDGVADAYDQLLDYVAGEYDLFVTLQSDLQVDDDWLRGHIEVHENNPDIDLVNGDWKGRDPTDREVEPNERPYYVGRNFSAKAGALEAIDGWDPNFLRGEDWDMRIRLAGAGVRSYARTAIGYEWQQDDPYITMSKAKRRPTSLTFLSKYGPWYLWFHPSHVVADALSVGGLLSGVAAVVTLPVLPLSLLFTLLFVGFLVVYWGAHVALRGGVDQNFLIGPVRKQLLNGVAVLYAAKRIAIEQPDWNMTGFEPENIPRYKF
jgi:hypothetical protein